MIPRKKLTPEQAYQKLKHYCAYQERSHMEVKTKAYSFGLRKSETEELTSKLIEEGCLNEERYARSFAGGKFRMKQWGRVKIKAELRKRQVSSYCINLAIQEIEEKKYKEVLNRLAIKRWESIKGPGTNLFIKMAKTRDYLLLKGFESNLVTSEIQQLSKKEKAA